MQARLLEDVRSHREIRVPVATGVRAVRADSADLGGEVKHELGVGVVEHTRRVVHRGEVVVGAPRREDVMPFGFEALDEVRAEKASAAGNERAHRRRVQASQGGRTVVVRMCERLSHVTLLAQLETRWSTGRSA